MRREIAGEYGLLVAQLIIDTRQPLMFIFIVRNAKLNQAAGTLAGDQQLTKLSAGPLIDESGIILLTNGAFNVICLPPLQAGDSKAVKSPDSIAGVGS